MSEEHQIWDRKYNEPPIWFQRFTRYRLMEPVRSVAATYLAEHHASNDVEQRQKVPGAWYEIANQWDWEKRASAWDDYQTAHIEETIIKERAKVLKSRYALMHKRVKELDQLAQKLLDYTKDEDKVWLPDVKAIGNGPGAERVDLIQFNDGLFREIRACFADLASELGERVKKTDATVTITPKTYIDLGEDEDGSEE